MIWRLRIGNWRWTFSFAHITDVAGVNSILPDGKHILMWDFDDVKLYNVKKALLQTQKTYELPEIHILNTGKPDHFIAYCFKKVSWRTCIEIIAYTVFVDPQFFKYGVYREKFTLRVTAKEGRTPKIVETLRSPFPADVDVEGLMYWVKYETLADKTPIGKIELVVHLK